MDLDSPSPKRRKTSSHSPSSSRHSSQDPLRASPSPRHRDLDTPLRRTARARSRSTSSPRRLSFEPLSRDLSETRDGSDEEEDHTFWRARRRSRSRHSRDGGLSSRSFSSRSERSSSAQAPEPPIESAPSILKTLNFRPVFTLPKSHVRGISCLKFSPNGAYLATSSADARIILYSTSTTPFTYLKTLTGHLAGVNTIAWSPDSTVLASGSDDKSIRLWYIATGTPYPTLLLGHHNYVYSLAFSPKGNMLVSGSFDEAVFLWDVRSARVMRSLPAHSDPVGGVDFLRDSTMVCSCAGDGLIRIWDAATGQCLKTLVDEDRKPVTSVRFSPNGKLVLAWTLDSCIRLWDYVQGVCVKTFQGHVNRNYSLGGTIGSYMQDREAFVVSGSEDGDLVAWDVSSKEILWRGEGDGKVVLGADFYRRAGDGRGMLVSGGLDREVRVWIECDDGDEEEGEGGMPNEEVVNGNHLLSGEHVDVPMSSPTTGLNGVPEEIEER